MTFFRSLLLVCPAVCLLAQDPPKPATVIPAPKTATPVPLPTVTLSREDPPKMPAVPPDRVVLKIGDISFTAAEFDEMVEGLPEQYRASARGQGRKQFADNLVKMFVLAQEARREKLDQTPAYKSQSMFAVNNLLAGLAYNQLGKEIKVDEVEVRKDYDAHKGDYEEVTARHILIRVEGAPMPVKPGQKELSDAEALAKATELRKKIVAGEDFAKLAEAESDDVGSAANGGSLGSFRHGQMVPSFDQAAFSMKDGEVSEPIKTQYGYHVIKVESHKTKSFEEAKPEIEKRMQPEQTAKALEEMVKKNTSVYDPEFFNVAKQ